MPLDLQLKLEREYEGYALGKSSTLQITECHLMRQMVMNVKPASASIKVK
jgi:hypothetical protein